MTAHLYYYTHTNPLPTQNARVATVLGQVDENGKDAPPKQIDPCGDPGQAVRGSELITSPSIPAAN
jgi:hypothetical protein